MVCLVLVVVATVVGVAVFARGIGAIVRTVRVGGPVAGRWTPVGPRLATLAREVLGHGRFQHRPVVKVAHWVVMVSFPLLFLTLVTGYGQVVDPGFALPLIGHFAPLEWAIEAIAWASLLGILRADRAAAAAAARAEHRALAVLRVEPGAGVLRRGDRAGRRAGGARAARARVRAGRRGRVALPADRLVRVGVGRGADGDAGDRVVVVATVKIAVSMSWFVVVGLQPTMGVAWHRFLAIVNVYARREPAAAPRSARSSRCTTEHPVDLAALEDLPDDARLGVGAIEDFTWKGLLDFSTCTECGRCQDQCPAWATGKPLSARSSSRSRCATTPRPRRPYLQAGSATSPTRASTCSARGVIDPDALWACTMCGACVQQCPVDIEHVDAIVDMRRYQVLMESAFPKELGGTFTKLERQGNPWGLPARNRLAWAKGLDFEVPVVGVDVESAAEVEYLFWVGCAGAYEDRANRTTKAVAELLHTAGVSFAVLGDGESCTGDPARRAGNELLFQMLASANVEMLNEVGAQRIVVTCAHCFNTIAREYPQLGGRYEVVHHTELLNTLVADGRLTPLPSTDERTTSPTTTPATWAGTTRSTPRRASCSARSPASSWPRCRATASSRSAAAAAVRACGWRSRSARASAPPAPRRPSRTGASVVATACPFCTVMLTDGVAARRRRRRRPGGHRHRPAAARPGARVIGPPQHRAAPRRTRSTGSVTTSTPGWRRPTPTPAHPA